MTTLNKTIDPQMWLDALYDSGCRITAVQELLVHIFAHTDYPLSAEQAWEYARESRPETGRATVYRTVEKLENLGLLRRVHGYKGCSHLMPVLPESFVLFICLDCGRASYLDRQPLHDFVKQVEQGSGHQVSESRVQLFGTCTACQAIQNP